MVGRRIASAAALAALALAGCGGSADAPEPSAALAPTTTAPESATTEVAAPTSAVGHVHGLAVDPADGSLFVATHAGLWRLGAGEEQGERVGEVRHDLMGFAAPTKGRLIASGHPTPEDAGSPPLLGLLESRDGGLSWAPVSLSGEADFHALRTRGRTIYGFDATSARLLASRDGGASWDERTAPGAILDLAIDPADPERLVATGESGIVASDDGGETWSVLVPEAIGFLAWDEELGLFIVDGAGVVARSEDGGASWEPTGQVPGRPAAFVAAGGLLSAALHDGTLYRSADGGATWAPLGAL